MRLLICYDILDPKRLRKVERIVSDVAQRLQDSLYEGEFDGAQLQALQQKLNRAIHRHQDSVRYYPVCARDLALRFAMQQVDQSVCGAGWVV
jgi:CRISPR-associated protein Cas2